MGRIDDPDAFETRLRAALGSGAATVEPDPRTFAYTRRRHRRRCLLRQTSVGAVIAGVIALALLAGPGLSMRPDVTFPAAEQPPPLPPPAPAPRPPDGPMAPPMGPEPESATAGAPLVVAAPSGEVRVLVPGGPPEMPYLPVPAAELPSPPCASGAEPCDKTVTDLAVRPGSTPERLVYATRQVLPDRCLADIALFDVEVRSGGSGGAHDVIGVDGCPTAPVWSPDGAYVAWAEGQSVTIARWEGVDITGVEADAVPVEGLPKLTDLELVSWLPNDGAGSLFVRGAHEDGGIGYTTVPIERDGAAHRLRADAATRLPPGTLGLQSGGAGGDGFPRAVSLQSIQDDTGATSSISLFSGEGREPQTIELEFGLMDPSDPEGRHVWLTSTDGVVLFGDGVDDAWVTEVTDQGLGEPVPLGLPVRAGGVLEPGAIPPSMEDDLAPDPSAPAPAEPPAGVVLVEPTGVRVSTPGGAPVSPALTCAGPSDCGDVVRIALRPGSTAERYDVATHHVQGDRCISGVALGRGRAAPATELSLTRFAGADFGPPNPCVGAPAWSADGRYVAWIDREALSTAGWDDEAGTAVDGISGGPLGPMAGFREARVERWVWERGGPARAEGYLEVLTVADDGERGTWRVPVTATSPNGFEVGRPELLDTGPGELLAVAGGTAEPFTDDVAPYELRGVRQAGAWSTSIIRPGAGQPLALPPGVVHPSDPDAVRVWMAARGDTVLVGDGVGTAWHIRRLPDGWSEPSPLPNTVLGADLLDVVVPGPE